MVERSIQVIKEESRMGSVLVPARVKEIGSEREWRRVVEESEEETEERDEREMGIG